MDVQTRILLVVAQHGALTRREIAEKLGMSVSSVAKAVGSLARAALVVEEEKTSAAQGRPALAVGLRPSAGYAVGVAVAGDYLTASLTDMCGKVLGRMQRRTVLTTSKSHLMDQLLSVIGATIETAGIRPELILGYGIGLHAPLDNQTGKCAGWPNTPEWSSLWEGLALRDELVGDLGPNTLVGNANRFAALAEQRFGSGQGEDHFFYIHIGQGVGGAAFLGGRPYPTLRGVSGEVGHITVDENGARCNCGNVGCLEALISTPAVLQYARSRLEAGRESLLRSMCSDDWSQLTVGMIVEGATRGDKFSYNILNRYGELAGTGLAAAMNLLGTELVIVRSEFVQGQDLTIEAIRRTVILRALPIISRHARVIPATFGADGPSLGAATCVIQQAVTHPTRMLAIP